MILRTFFPYQEELPILFNFAHSGNLVPCTISAREKDLEGSSSLDIFLNSSSYGVSVFRAIYSRHWVDLCESPKIISGKKFRCDAIPLVTSIEKFMNKKIKDDHRLITRRLNKFYHPYFEKMDARIADLKSRHEHILIIDLHTLNEKAQPSHFGMSPFKDTQINRQIYNTVLSVVRDGEKLQLVPKIPNVSRHFLDHFGASKDGIHVLQLAFSKKLLESEEIVNEYNESKLQRTIRELSFLTTGALKALPKI